MQLKHEWKSSNTYITVLETKKTVSFSLKFEYFKGMFEKWNAYLSQLTFYPFCWFWLLPDETYQELHGVLLITVMYNVHYFLLQYLWLITELTT